MNFIFDIGSTRFDDGANDARPLFHLDRSEARLHVVRVPHYIAGLAHTVDDDQRGRFDTYQTLQAGQPGSGDHTQIERSIHGADQLIQGR